MTRIPTIATRVEPVYGWAAVAPDGTIAPWSAACAEGDVSYKVGAALFEKEVLPQLTAYRAGWRVIRVQISPAGEGEGRS